MRETDVTSLKRLRAKIDECRRCPLYKRAIQAVPGEGAARAKLMLVGEQPGNDEDLDGHPFVGPAGRILDRALADVGIEREKVFVTNAVKHFKFEPRGKKRLHKRPNAHEIERCHIWLGNERRLVKPALVVGMGATAARSLMGKTVTISRMRGAVTELPDGGKVLITVHPSFLLRIPERARRHAEYSRFVADMRVCRKFLADAA